MKVDPKPVEPVPPPICDSWGTSDCSLDTSASSARPPISPILHSYKATRYRSPLTSQSYKLIPQGPKLQCSFLTPHLPLKNRSTWTGFHLFPQCCE